MEARLGDGDTAGDDGDDGDEELGNRDGAEPEMFMRTETLGKVFSQRRVNVKRLKDLKMEERWGRG